MHNIITDPKYKVLGDELINDMLLLNYKYTNEEKKTNLNTSVAVACFVTSWARLKLFDDITKIHDSKSRISSLL